MSENIHKTEYDWEQLVSEGHVYSRQLRTYNKSRAFRAVSRAFIAMTISAFAFVALSTDKAIIPQKIIDAVAPDPLHYIEFSGVDIPGHKGKLSYQYAPLVKAIGAPQQGLTQDQFTALANAVKADFQANGPDADKWTTVANLNPAPHLTRPEKAFDAENREKVGSGEVLLNKSNLSGVPDITIIAWVNGRLNVVGLGGMSANVFLGEKIDGFTHISNEYNVTNLLKSLVPAINKSNKK